MDDILEQIKQLSIPVIESFDLILYKVEKHSEYGNVIYTVFVDDPNSFDIDIDKVSNISSVLIDKVNDLLPDNGYLEVSSVGIERPLTNEDDFNKALDMYIYVSLYEKHPDINEKEIYGTLTKINEDTIELDTKIKTKEKHIIIEKSKIANARLAVKF